MNKHTPGPWYVEVTHYDDGVISGRTICHGTNNYSDGPEGEVCKVLTGNEFDAKLITAAPDLLGALENMLDYPSEQWAIAQARFMVSKARGE